MSVRRSMRCREVRRHLSEGGTLTPEEKRHIAECPECARHAQAAELLNQAFETAGHKEAFPETPFQVLRNRVETLEKQTVHKEKNIMFRIARQISGRRRIRVGIAVAAVVLLVVTLVPFSYERTVGYEVTFNGLNDEAVEVFEQVSNAVHLLGYGDVSLSYSRGEDGTSFWMMNLPSKTAAREAAAAFVAVTGCTTEAEIKPVRRTVSGSLLAQARDKLTRIEIDSEGLSDAEIEAEIVARLAEHGFERATASVNTDADGMRRIDIDLEADSPLGGTTGMEMIIVDEASENIDFNLDEGFDHAEISALVKANKDMDETELKALLESRLAEMGYGDANVIIKHSETGERRIMIGAPK